jgi:hypothetical protein
VRTSLYIYSDPRLTTGAPVCRAFSMAAWTANNQRKKEIETLRKEIESLKTS